MSELIELATITSTSTEVFPFPFCVKEFFFRGEKPKYFVLKAAGNLIAVTNTFKKIGTFTTLGTDLYKILFYENDIDLPFHLSNYSIFEFMTDSTGILYGVKSNKVFDENCEIEIKNGISLIFKGGIVGVNKCVVKHSITLDEYISFRLNKISLNNRFDIIDLLCLILYRNPDTSKSYTNEIRAKYQNCDVELIYDLLKDFFKNKYMAIFDGLPEGVKNNHVNLGYSVDSDNKILLYGM
jgi:hypothetical protein